jgi:RNA polymerase subunit RPABC4/transcription elongation factor Spt4
MACYNCRSIDTEKEEIIRYFSSSGFNPFFIENLPVDVCRVCGPTGFSSKTMEGMEKISQGKASPVGTQAVRVFDFNNPRGKQEKVSELSAISKVVGE